MARTHGMTNTAEYRSWCHMKERCNNPNVSTYHRYGGRGITVCERWHNSFENLYSDMGDKPKGFSLDRIDNDKGYSPENCRWADQKTQMGNTSKRRELTYLGETRSLQEWSEISGLCSRTISTRIDRDKWTVERALTQTTQKGTKSCLKQVGIL